MPKAKKSSTQVEVLEDVNPWLTAYKQVRGGELAEGEITIRGFAKLLTENSKKEVTRNAAKSILSNMCNQGVAVCVGMKVISQEGLQPARVAVYRLIDIETEGGNCGKCGSKLDIVRPGKFQCPKCE